jgi:hypothetical protein
MLQDLLDGADAANIGAVENDNEWLQPYLGIVLSPEEE